jgi:hypothetical protein
MSLSKLDFVFCAIFVFELAVQARSECCAPLRSLCLRLARLGPVVLCLHTHSACIGCRGYVTDAQRQSLVDGSSALITTLRAVSALCCLLASLFSF